MTEATAPQIDTAAAQAAGVDLVEPAYTDYWGFDESERFWFPDHRQWIDFKKMNEGDRAKYQRDTRSDITLERTTGNAKMKADPSAERHALVKATVKDWNLYRKGQKVPFSLQTLDQWLGQTNPAIVDELEKAIRKANPWLLGEMTVEQIDKEISDLQEMREVAVKREQGEGVSSDR